MRGREREIPAAVIAFLFFCGFLWSRFQKEVYTFPQMPEPVSGETADLSEKAIAADESFDPNIRPSATGWTNFRDKKILVDETFSSNLPLVVIDTGDQEPKRGVVWDGEKDYYVSTGEDPYAYGEIFVIDNPEGTNSPKDSASVHSLCKLKIRGNSSGNYDKKQYLLKLIDEDGKPESRNILEMGGDNEWILNVSFIDKSLLRNYLAYTTAGEFMPFTPDAKYCEVLWKDGTQYRYEGVYLMLESIKEGKHRVDLPAYSDNGTVTPALLRRDRYNVNGIMLENYATERQLTSGYLDIEYPKKDVITKKGIQNVTEQVSRFERALYSENWKDFVQYRAYIDMDSFVDYFIVNEFFLNYDAGYNSTYIYMDYSGKLYMGPVWDFDQAMDNNATEIANLQTTAFHSAPWFDRLLQDPIFTEMIIERYAELRSSILSDASIRAFTESVIEYLGPAIDRDWARWGYYYTDGNYLSTRMPDGSNRNTQTHREETEKILSVLSQHGAWMDERLDSLYQFKKITLEEAKAQLAGQSVNYSPALAVLFIAVFQISVILVIKYDNES